MQVKNVNEKGQNSPQGGKPRTKRTLPKQSMALRVSNRPIGDGMVNNEEGIVGRWKYLATFAISLAELIFY
jgi:hypothetical protein